MKNFDVLDFVVYEFGFMVLFGEFDLVLNLGVDECIIGCCFVLVCWLVF